MGARNELVTSTTIAEAVTRLMASKEGEEVRKRAEELGVATQQSVEEGGVSRMELDSFVAHITSRFIFCHGEFIFLALNCVPDRKSAPVALLLLFLLFTLLSTKVKLSKEIL